ncbi:MAG: glycosyltransferase family 39 protein [Gemmataceae bacterium]|nr:glycosyltransferase family 39 protein [Gemmataceae bacterium]
MRGRFHARVADYAVLLAVAAVVTLPNLGTPSLWDVDEGVNAEAAREMREAGTWVIPTFNFELRTAKPVMLYWLQRASYAAFGVSEWSARLPSALAGWATILLTYELARRMFGRATGLLAGLVLASAIEFCVLAHAATPDATLLLFTALTYYLFWRGHENGGRGWWVPTAAACGLAALTKGPVGVALPGLVVVLYFAWNRELGRLWDRRLGWGILAGLLVAGPWYGLVTAETRGAWAKAFFLTENVNRVLTPMEDHRGPIFYHAVALLALFAPWSVFIAGVVWYGIKGTRRSDPSTPGTQDSPFRAHRFLVCWVGAYLIFFSFVSTKLPNYILPLYPALAILTARFLVRWRDEELTLPRWYMPAAVVGMVLIGIGVGVGLMVAGGVGSVLPAKARVFPGLERWAVLGLIPLGGAAVIVRFLRTGDRRGFVTATAGTAVLFIGLIAAFPPGEMDRYKAPRDLVRESGVGDPARDVRVGCYDWFQPSVVFYARREVSKLPSPEKAAEFLAVPTPGYLFVPEPTWRLWVEKMVTGPNHIAARHYDFYRNCEVLVITNEPDTAGTASR